MNPLGFFSNLLHGTENFVGGLAQNVGRAVGVRSQQRPAPQQQAPRPQPQINLAAFAHVLQQLPNVHLQGIEQLTGKHNITVGNVVNHTPVLGQAVKFGQQAATPQFQRESLPQKIGQFAQGITGAGVQGAGYVVPEAKILKGAGVAARFVNQAAPAAALSAAGDLVGGNRNAKQIAQNALINGGGAGALNAVPTLLKLGAKGSSKLAGGAKALGESGHLNLGPMSRESAIEQAQLGQLNAKSNIAALRLAHDNAMADIANGGGTAAQKAAKAKLLADQTNKDLAAHNEVLGAHLADLKQMGVDPITHAPAPAVIPGQPGLPKGAAYAGPNSHILNPTLKQKVVGIAKQAAEPFMNPNPENTSVMGLLNNERGTLSGTGGADHPLIGKTVKAGDRGNLGTVMSANPDGSLNVRFTNKTDKTTATKTFTQDQLTPLGGKTKLSNQQLVDKANAKVAEAQNGATPPVGEPVKPGEQERLYGKHLSQDPTVPVPVQEGLTLGYNRKPNVQTMQTAAEHINKQTPDVAAQEINRITGTPTDHQQAVGQLLIRHFIDTNQVEKAIMVANKVSKNSTEAGRAVQILQASSKLTPEGALRDVMGVINKANEGRSPAKQITLTPEKANEITDLANKVQTLEPGSREHQVAVGLLKKAIEEVVPPTFLRKVSTLQTIAQLLNPKTGVRNILGNLVMNGLEHVSGVTAAGIDKTISVMGGQRTTVLPQLGVATKGFFKGANYGAQDVKLGIRTAGSLGQTEVMPAIFKNKVLHALEQATGYSLSVPDRAFFQSAFDESVANQMKAQGLKKATTEVQQQATSEALYKTFQNNSAIAQALSKTKRGLNFGKDFGMGDLLLKYPKTPGNILSVGLDYSPVGFVKGLAQFVSNIHSLSPNIQREAVMNLSRGITGTGLITGGAFLAANGIITARASSDKDKAASDKFNGEGPFSFNVTALHRLLSGQSSKPQPGDVSMNYDWLQPNSMQLSMGANLVLNHKDAQGMLNAALDSFDSASSSVTQQPVLAGPSKFISTAVGSNGQPGSFSGAVGQAVGSAPASFIPTIVNQAGQLTDNTARSTYDPTFMGTALNQIKAKLPGARETLQPKVGVDGQVQNQYDPSTGGNNLFNVLLNPAFVTRFKDNPVINEVNRLNQSTGEVKQYPHVASSTQNLNGKNAKLQPEQFTSLQKNLGTQTMGQFQQIINSPAYKAADDTQRVNMLSSALTNVNKVAKVQSLGGDMSKLNTQQKILNAGGNLTTKLPGVKGATGSPADKYQAKLATFNAAVKAGTLTGAKAFSTQQLLNKEAITSKYSQDVLDFYGLSKSAMNDYFKQNPQDAQKLYDQAKQLDSQLGANKFKHGLAIYSGKGKNASKPKKAPRFALKQVHLSKAPKIKIAKAKTKGFKLARSKPSTKISLTA